VQDVLAPPSDDHRPHLWIVPRAPAEHAPRARFVHPLWLVFGVAGGPLAWTLTYTFTAALLSPACSKSNPTFLGMYGALVVELLLAIGGAIVAMGAGIVAWSIVRRVSRPEEGTAGGSIGQAAFWSLGGMFVSAVSLFAIAATGATAITLNGICA
jgi:hypothetical protein